MLKKMKTSVRSISLRSAVLLIISSLIIEYILLEGSALGLTQRYLASHAAAGFQYKNLKYDFKDYSLTLDILEETEVHVTPDKGEDLLFNIYFTNSNLLFRGYLQLWHIEDLEYFLINSKYLSPFDFISYNMDNISNSYSKGFKTEWTADFGDYYVSGKEFWWPLSHTDNVIRLSFFTDSKEFPENLNPIIQHIIDSVQVKSHNN